MNYDFILGSVEKVERLWSISKSFITEHSRSMTPQLFEEIIFLKINELFWDAQLVREAINGALCDRTATRMEAHSTQE